VVKYKEYRSISILYIYVTNMRESFIIHELNESWNNEDQAKIEYLLHEMLTEITLVQLIISSLLFTLVHAVLRRHRS